MRTKWLPLVSAALAGAAALAVGSWAVRQAHPHGQNLHDIIHRRVTLTTEERARLEAAEARYGQRRAELEARIRADNAALATAIRQDPELSPAAMEASADIERAAGELQRVTLEHIFEMRSALDPRHRGAYDDVLTDALTKGQ